MTPNPQQMLDLVLAPVILAVVIGILAFAAFFFFDANWKNIITAFRKIRRIN